MKQTGKKIRHKSASPGEAEAGSVRTLRDEQKELTRARLIEAARELFSEIGVKATTIDKIARRAGTTRATFYLHFEDKAQMASQFVSIYSDEAVDGMRSMFTTGRPSKTLIRAWLHSVGDFCRRHGDNLMEIEPLLVGKRDYMSNLVHDCQTIGLAGFERFITRFRGAERDQVRAELLLLSLLTQRYLFVVAVHGIEFPEKRAFDVLVDTWYRFLSRSPHRRAAKR